jgi:hypothetical protein
MEALLVVALLLVPLGMVGFHALQGRDHGRIGRAGFWTVVAASLAVVLGSASYLWWGSVFGSSLLWLAMPVGPLVLLVGLMLYGVATLQAKVLSRWCGVAFIVAMPAALASSIVGAFASVFIWCSALCDLRWATCCGRTGMPQSSNYLRGFAKRLRGRKA